MPTCRTSLSKNRDRAGRSPLHRGRAPVSHRQADGRCHPWRGGRRGLGLALVPDLRVTCPEARFSANFTRLGFHPGFGLTHTLPALIGPAKAAMMFYTSRRVPGEEAYRIGLADLLVAQSEVRAAAQKLAAEIAENSPLGVLETRAPPCAPGSPTECVRPPISSWKNRRGCAGPPTSRKASTPSTNVACRSLSANSGAVVVAWRPGAKAGARSHSCFHARSGASLT